MTIKSDLSKKMIALRKDRVTMYINSAYLHNSLLDFQDKSKPLVIGSCGVYRLRTKSRLPTCRPRGRVDYQLLYIASGIGHFHFDHAQNDTVVPAGSMVLYRPREYQQYEYYGKDRTEVYWIHFTGNDVKNILRKYGIDDKTHVFYTGTLPEYEMLFTRMISELQQCKDHYEEMLELSFRQLLIVAGRQLSRKRSAPNEYLDREMTRAIQYFQKHYNREIRIDEYAASRGMSVSWFIRIFRQYTGKAPMQYLVSLRITNAQMLLETTNYSVAEIASMSGYDNPLYFSRLFRKHTGFSPSQYRKLGY